MFPAIGTAVDHASILHVQCKQHRPINLTIDSNYAVMQSHRARTFRNSIDCLRAQAQHSIRGLLSIKGMWQHET